MLTFTGAKETTGPQALYFQLGKLVRIGQHNNDVKFLDLYQKKQSNYSIILGTPFSGKTTLATQLKERFSFSVLDYEKST
jgi:stage III sporulation protein SpoIIIAA